MGAGDVLGAGAAEGGGVMVLCFPILPPPPNRLASAEAANRLKHVKAIVRKIKNRFMVSLKTGWVNFMD